MAALWVQSQSIVSAYISASVFDRHRAEDIVQEVARAVAERFDRFDSDRPFTPWVLGIARNQVLKYYRQQASSKVHFSEAGLERFGEVLADADDIAEDRREALRECLRDIGGKSRTVLDMRYDEGNSVKDIGTRLGITASTVSVMLYRVRSKLLDCIQRKIDQQAHQ